MKEYIEERAVEIANYIIENNDVTERLVQINKPLAQKAREVLDINKSERHIRGGLATKEKYLYQHQLEQSRMRG